MIVKLIKYMKKKKCTETTLGEIIDIYSILKEFPQKIRVEYIVNDKTYEKVEEIKTKTITRLKDNTVEEQEIPYIGNHKIGDFLHICYNPNNPKSSYIEENNYA